MIPNAEAQYIVNLLANANGTQERLNVQRVAVDAVERYSNPVHSEVKCTPEALHAFIGRCSQGYVERAWKV